jgi:carbonic anhydrase
MRLFEAILQANQRRVAGEKNASVAAAEFSSALPIAALTCIDARLNHLLPEMLGIAEEHFIWLRNAGNIITGPLSSTMRSLALGCAVKGAKEVVIIGHTDCLVCKTTAIQLLDRLSALGVDRQKLPENLVEYFGLFGSERQNVIRGVDFIRASPLIGDKVPIHGLLIDVKTGKLEWVVNGYQSFETVVPGKVSEAIRKADHALESFAKIGHFAAEELKLPTAKIGEFATAAHDWAQKAQEVATAIESKIGSHSLPSKTVQTPVTAAPPPLRPTEQIRRLVKMNQPKPPPLPRS